MVQKTAPLCVLLLLLLFSRVQIEHTKKKEGKRRKNNRCT
jgi:hypothetical protein